jgi:hypothetical protein
MPEFEIDPKEKNVIAFALAKAQGEMTIAAFNTQNAFLKNRYANLESVLNAVREILCKYEICHTECVEYFDDKPFLVVKLIHSSGQFLESKLKLEPKENTPQCLGGLITYYRRYLLSAICSLTQGAEPDDDGEKAMARISAAQIEELNMLMGDDTEIQKKVFVMAKVEKIENISTNGYENLVKFIHRLKQPVEKIGKAEHQNLMLEISNNEKLLKDVLNHYKINDLIDLPQKLYIPLMKWLEKRTKKNENN